MLDVKELTSEIENIVQAHSGGVKFIELTSELLEKYYTAKMLADTEALSVDKILEAVKASAKLKILNYSYWMTPDFNREKLFIYTP